MESTHLRKGTLLQGGKYEIVRFISSGGFGCTYEAIHTQFKSRVAIKEFFIADFCNRDETNGSVSLGTQSKAQLVTKLRKKFVDEASAIFQMHEKHPDKFHKHIIRVIDIFEENGTAYYVMEYIDGPSLNDMIKSQGCLPEGKAVKYIREVADALKYVHSLNRLHLDVKPGNIMVDKHDNAVLIDFGASKQYDEMNGENTSTLMGKTPGFAPPEQMSNEVVKFTPSTDIYALGATFYKLLTGITPPSANMRISGERLMALPQGTSNNVAQVISASLQLNKTDRPQSIDEFLAILDGRYNYTGEVIAIGSDDKTKVDDKKTVEIKASTVVAGAIARSKEVKSKPDTTSSTKKAEKKKSPLKPVLIALACVVVVGIVVYFVMSKQQSGGIGENVTISNDTIETVEKPELAQDIAPEENAEMQPDENVEDNMPNTGDMEKDKENAEQNSSTTNSSNDNSNNQQVQTNSPNTQQTQVSQQTTQQTQTSQQNTQQTQESKSTKNTINGHEYVDLGLSVKWATCNVGASSPTGYGNYYAWGETSPKSEYTKKNNTTSGKSLGDIAGDSRYDAARANWG
ncbi:MAG: serine/threonine protein kinase, partial [Prevotella sp.]|nr:serine/threonine protein kinase [Prevotella sp.]